MKLKIRRPYGYEEGSLAHSAKGSTWEDHKYVKVVDGVYYYPDNYEGGRHVSDAKGADAKDKNGEQSLDSFYSEWERSLGSLKLDPKSVQTLLMFGEDKNGNKYDNFKSALEKAGIDTSKISDDKLNEMRYKVVDHYKEEFSKEKENFDSEGNRINGKEKALEKKASSKSKKKESDDDKKTNEKDDDKKKTKKKRGGMSDFDYEGGKVKHSDHWSPSLYHHGILGMKWGKKNGPPYPLDPSDHSAAEKKAMKAGAKKASSMSNEELADYNKRKTLENQYNKLSGQEKTKLDYAKDMTDTTANSARQIKNILNEGGQKRPEKVRPDLSDKSDKELRDAINRENLERQYTELFGEERQDKVAKGKEYISRGLTGAIGGLTLASLGIQIALGVRALKGK